MDSQLYQSLYNTLPAEVIQAQHNEDKRRLSFADGVITPLAQAGITAGVLTLPIVSAAWSFHWPGNVGQWAVLTFTFTLALSWALLLRRWVSSTTPIWERLTGRDLNNDGWIGEPDEEPQPQPIRVQVSAADGKSSTFATFNLSPHKLAELAGGILTGRPFSESEWSGGGRPFTRAEFRELRAELLKRGLLLPAGDEARQGFRFSPAGRAVLRHFADQHSPTGGASA